MEETYLKEEAVTLDDQLETWRPVVGYEGKYEVSDLGRVRSLDYNNTGTVVVLKQRKLWSGYMKVSLFRKQRIQCTTAHQLVAKAFIGPPMGKQVNHKDGNKTNNALSNLEYLTCSENNLHALRIGLHPRGQDRPRAKLTDEGVREVWRLYKSGITGAEIARKFLVSDALIRAILKGKTWKHVVLEETE